MAKFILCDVQWRWQGRDRLQSTEAEVTDVIGHENKHKDANLPARSDMTTLLDLAAHMQREEASEKRCTSTITSDLSKLLPHVDHFHKQAIPNTNVTSGH